MITKIFNGNKLRHKINDKIRINLEKKKILYKKNPYLAVLFINNCNSSNLYIKNKIFFCNNLNVNCILFRSSKTIKFKTLFLLVKILNNDNSIDGFFIQKPLPYNLNKEILFKFIKIDKDVDLLNPINLKNFYFSKNKFLYPCVFQSVLSVLNSLYINNNKLKILLFGFSSIIGKPIYYNFLFKNYILTIFDKFSNYEKLIIKKYDIIIIGIGIPFFLSKESVKYGSIIIDIGINYIFNKYIIGDSNFYNLNGKVSWITPVPFGIGPLTVSFLLLNTLKLYLNKNFYLE